MNVDECRFVKNDIHRAAVAGIEWLKSQRPSEIKDLSRAAQALSLWNDVTPGLIEILQSKKKGSFWNTNKPILDTSRAISALLTCVIEQPDAINWILERQKNGNWNNNEIDTSYALIALGDAGVRNEAGCEWLVHNYGEKWAHVGTTSLIITALIKQDRDRYGKFIKDRAGWILSKRQSGGWIYTATSNLAIQTLIFAGEDDLAPSIQWLLKKQSEGNWGDITSTSLSLISLKMYLDKLNSDVCS